LVIHLKPHAITEKTENKFQAVGLAVPDGLEIEFLACVGEFFLSLVLLRPEDRFSPRDYAPQAGGKGGKPRRHEKWRQPGARAPAGGQGGY